MAHDLSNYPTQVAVRLTADLAAWLYELRQSWKGPAGEVNNSDVIREAVRRAVEAERKSRKSVK